jgi:hypothetical protein
MYSLSSALLGVPWYTRALRQCCSRIELAGGLHDVLWSTAQVTRVALVGCALHLVLVQQAVLLAPVAILYLWLLGSSPDGLQAAQLKQRQQCTLRLISK